MKWSWALQVNPLIEFDPTGFDPVDPSQNTDLTFFTVRDWDFTLGNLMRTVADTPSQHPSPTEKKKLIDLKNVVVRRRFDLLGVRQLKEAHFYPSCHFVFLWKPRPPLPCVEKKIDPRIFSEKLCGFCDDDWILWVMKSWNCSDDNIGNSQCNFTILVKIVTDLIMSTITSVVLHTRCNESFESLSFFWTREDWIKELQSEWALKKASIRLRDWAWWEYCVWKEDREGGREDGSGGGEKNEMGDE